MIVSALIIYQVITGPSHRLQGDAGFVNNYFIARKVLDLHGVETVGSSRRLDAAADIDRFLVGP